MKCPVCGKEYTATVCPDCGFDDSRNYERYPTFGQISGMPSISHHRRQWENRTDGNNDSTVSQTAPSPHYRSTLPPAVYTAILMLIILIVLWIIIPDSDQATHQTNARAVEILSTMTLEEKIYQMFIVTPEQITGYQTVTQSGKVSQEAIKNQPVGGIIYFSKNLIDREQCTEMISKLQSYSKLGLFIAVDEEGGMVSRLDDPEMDVTQFPPMLTIGESGDLQKAYDVGMSLGEEIAELGFNLDFAPVADIFSDPENHTIGNRAFSTDPKVAARMVKACVTGFESSGTMCTLKHFPGYGTATVNSYYDTVESDKTMKELMKCELLPFLSGIEAGAPVIMVGHITLPNITDADFPATLSHELVTELLREELGYSGLVVTDAMDMQPITRNYAADTAAVMAVQAGVDLILMPEDLDKAVDGLLFAVACGELTEARIDESVLRILDAKLEYDIIQ